MDSSAVRLIENTYERGSMSRTDSFNLFLVAVSYLQADE
ncbi:MAG: hypothetical protein K0S61_1998 [Anaerocolumna sp.]|jgi:hypothetical protein|nr:hypothetical protein [Anaerocolumna sp.]